MFNSQAGCSSPAKTSMHPLEKQGCRTFSQLDEGGSGHWWSVQHSQELKNDFVMCCLVCSTMTRRRRPIQQQYSSHWRTGERILNTNSSNQAAVFNSFLFLLWMTVCRHPDAFNRWRSTHFKSPPPSIFVEKHGHEGLIWFCFSAHIDFSSSWPV